MATRQKPSDILTLLMAVDGKQRRGHPTNPVGLPGQRQRDDTLAADVDASSFQDSRSDATATRARRLARCTRRDAEPFRFVAFAEHLGSDSPAHARQVLAPSREFESFERRACFRVSVRSERAIGRTDFDF